jgi:putative ABC transport system permease protein
MKAASPLRYALRRARHGWQQRSALLLVAALAVAVGAAGAVGLFSERVRAALMTQSGASIGADAVLRSRQPIPEALRGAAEDAGLRTAGFATMPSVVFGPAGTSALASLKAVDREYPLRSALRVADAPFGEARVAPPPERGEVYVASRLWTELGLSSGAEVQVGSATLRVAAALAFEPDRGGGFGDLAPRLMLRAEDLAAAGLTGAGARVRYALQLAGAQSALAAMRERAEAAGVAFETPAEVRRELATALERAGVFLDLTVVCALILAAAAAMIAADSFGRGLRDEAALLRVLGATRAFIGRALLGLLLTLGAVGIALGMALALAGQGVIALLADSLFDGGLPAPASWLPAGRAAVLGVLLLVGFAMPAVLAVRDVSPMRVFQRAADAARGSAWGLRGAALLGLVLLVGLQARSLPLTASVIGGAAALALLLYLIARGLLAGFEGLRRSGAAGAAWRLGLANLARRRRSAGGLAAALGLVLLALLLMAVVRVEMLAQWQASLPPGTPNVFLINVQAEQREPLRDFLAERGLNDVRLWPMARGRLVRLNGEAVSASDFADEETRRWINRDFNLSWSAELPEDNRLLEGPWWTPAEHEEALLSADEYAVERLELAIGDTLTLRFAGEDRQFTVHNLRSVQWDSFRPNFFLMTTPGALEGEVPTSWLTSFHLEEEQGRLLRDLVTRFPNITPIDIGALLDQVRAVMDRVVAALAFLLAFALAAGLIVLLAAIETSRAEREREVALLRTLGARRAFIARALLVEYGALGTAAGTLAAGVAQMMAMLLADRVFEIPFAAPWWPWLLGPVAGGLLVGGLGWLALRGITRVPPDRVLRLQAS